REFAGADRHRDGRTVRVFTAAAAPAERGVVRLRTQALGEDPALAGRTRPHRFGTLAHRGSGRSRVRRCCSPAAGRALAHRMTPCLAFIPEPLPPPERPDGGSATWRQVAEPPSGSN